MEKQIVVKSTVGLHASLAAEVVKAASKYSVKINLIYKNQTIDAKSILGLMSLAVPCGENVIVSATGDDALAAIEDISSILSKN